VLSKCDQRSAEVLDIGHGMRNVGVAQALSRLPCDRPGKHPVTDGRLVNVGAEEVGCSPDRRPDSARFVSPQQRLGNLRPDPATRASREVGQVFCERSVHRAICVKIVTVYEPRPRRGRPFDDRVHERRMHFRPLRVRRVDAVINHRCPLTRPLHVSLHSEVGADHLKPFCEVGSFTPNNGTYAITARREMTGHGETERTRPQNDMQLPFVDPIRCQRPHLLTKRGDAEQASALERRPAGQGPTLPCLDSRCRH
jgi:hypothetical protein